MKILKLTAENVKKLRAVEITPTGELVEITGRNGAGKSSVLDAIWWALAGTKHIQAVPIRKGATKPRIRLDLGELIVERRFTPAGSTLTVEKADGARYTSPQGILDALLGALTFDPLALVSQEPREQFETLRRLVTLEVDVDQLDALNRGDFDRRADLNREIKTLRAQADGIVVPPGVPQEPIDTAALMDRIADAAKVNADIETRRGRREQADQERHDLGRRAAAHRARAVSLRAEADAVDAQAADLERLAADLTRKLATAEPLPAPVDVDGIRAELTIAQATNRHVEAPPPPPPPEPPPPRPPARPRRRRRHPRRADHRPGDESSRRGADPTRAAPCRRRPPRDPGRGADGDDGRPKPGEGGRDHDGRHAGPRARVRRGQRHLRRRALRPGRNLRADPRGRRDRDGGQPEAPRDPDQGGLLPRSGQSRPDRGDGARARLSGVAGARRHLRQGGRRHRRRPGRRGQRRARRDRRRRRMSHTFRPAVRQNTPLIIGLAGPTKSGKTMSAHRLPPGLAPGGAGALVTAGGPRAHQYADTFTYVACDLAAPFRPAAYTEALEEAAKIRPATLIIDSASHMHDGPGGILEWHDEIARRMAKGDEARLEKMSAPAWVEPKAAENHFVYQMLSMQCPVILCFRAKEKIKIAPAGKWIDLGWQPIAGERVAFETLFTLMLPPHSKGTPDLSISDMREPFDAMVPQDRPIDEDLGRQLAAWAAGQATPTTTPAAGAPPDRRGAALAVIPPTPPPRAGPPGAGGTPPGCPPSRDHRRRPPMAQEPAHTPVQTILVLIAQPWNRYLVRPFHVRADRLADLAGVVAALRQRIAAHELN